MLIDAHVHCVPSRIREEFFRIGLAAFFERFPADIMEEPVENLLSDMERAGVDASVVVTAGELDIFEKYAKTHPNKLFVAYVYDSRNPKEGFRLLRKAFAKHWRVIKCVKTVFPYLNQHPAQKEFFPLYRYCEREKLPIQFHMGGDPRMEALCNLLYYARLCSLFPKLKIVCLHAGGGATDKIPVLVDLWETVFVEMEGLQLGEAEGNRQPGTLRYLLEKMGSERLMFGSDRIFPEDKYFWRAQAVKSLSGEQAENVCWRTANKVFSLGLGKKPLIKKKELPKPPPSGNVLTNRLAGELKKWRPNQKEAGS